ncbi:hypothetical protein BB559_007551 [Furculomyces boomerangus]|nr:hypothetical protein BB559_007551 [Furculomyces boomerangus]
MDIKSTLQLLTDLKINSMHIYGLEFIDSDTVEIIVLKNFENDFIKRIVNFKHVLLIDEKDTPFEHDQVSKDLAKNIKDSFLDRVKANMRGYGKNEMEQYLIDIGEELGVELVRK